MKEEIELPDCGQSAWQLAAIQLSGWTSLPILASSLYVLQVNSFLGAIFTIVVGNAILWFLRLGILAMSSDRRQSTLDIAQDYLGLVGNWCIAILLLATTLFWFIAQTRTGSLTITNLLPIPEDPNIDQFTQISVSLGLISTLFCMGGMVLLRYLSIISFPILVIAFVVLLFTLPELKMPLNSKPLSFAGLTLVLGTNLGITADLPTFFRHSRSWSESVKGLTIIQLVSLAFAIASLFLGGIVQQGFQLNLEAVNAMGDLRYLVIGFIFLSLITANVANVYSASVGWELVAPKAFVGRKEYFILGLTLTTIFILVSGSALFSLQWCLEITESSLVNLCIILLIGFAISRRLQKMPDFYDQMTYFIAWFLSSAINVLQFSHLFLASISSLLTSTAIIVIIISTAFLFRRLTQRA